jgi:hypothetical protein
MRKNAFLLILSFVLPCFFSCDFAIPKAIEITGTPSIRFAETVDVGKMFTDLLDKAIVSNDKMSVFPCKQTTILTYLIHAELFNQAYSDVTNSDEFDDMKSKFPGMDLDYEHIGFQLDDNQTLIDGGEDNRQILPLSDIGSLLNGFEFLGGQTILYLSGSPLISKAKVNIKLEEVVDDVYTSILEDDSANTGIELNDKGSDIATWKTDGYNGTTYPPGKPINIPLNGKDIALSFKVYIPEGTVLTLADFKAGSIKAEIVVWMPFSFKATGEDGADLKFPEDSFFSSEDDLFGREKADDDNMFTDIIQSLSVNIKFQNNPFDGGVLIISSGSIEIKNQITRDILSFTVTEEDMKKINNPANWPFTPQPRMHFAKDAEVSFPRVFSITEFAFKAKIRYRIDF